MGCPPQTDLTRRLIRKFFRKHEGIGTKAALNEELEQLLKCWQKYGYNSESCQGYVDKLQTIKMQAGTNVLKIDGKNLSQYCLDQLNPPIYPKHQIGRYKDFYTGFSPIVNSLYDGLVMRKEIK